MKVGVLISITITLKRCYQMRLCINTNNYGSLSRYFHHASNDTFGLQVYENIPVPTLKAAFDAAFSLSKIQITVITLARRLVFPHCHAAIAPRLLGWFC